MGHINVIGAGLAGSEAAWQIARRGIKVRLYEMRPKKMTPAHHSDLCAELVCSNSLRANNLTNAVGLLKEEMRSLNSLIMGCADSTSVPAGGALAVDRTAFSQMVTQKLINDPLIEIVNQEVVFLPQGEITIVATGPLTSDLLSSELQKITGKNHLYFYDAAAPIVYGDTIDYEKVFWASRYNKGTADYLNCPMDTNEYERFYQELINAEVHCSKEFEKEIFFEGCMPIEVMAQRGYQTLLYGPLKPVGLFDEKKNQRPHAVVQLRRDNISGTLFNMVGFQTHLKWGEQKRVFRMIPGLENAEFARYGIMHRNTFINSPQVLKSTTQLKGYPYIFIAGQLSGVEGYVESTSSGLVAGINASRLYKDRELLVPPRESAIGSLMYYITETQSDNFQPMNITFGLMPSCNAKVKDKAERKSIVAKRALDVISVWKDATK
ncbi:MAG: methylenetetrahydrofolate--tRNA-(uracil(54)-C(5))-methyltransferase (FADH(2)-oxidizing) TrmFO [Clostridia bacterium]|nr:methylenetetrahydrofolate--tRNA-(uracil(54)-C(5))-methyltransferase (FADH(2)-oxidizing) TrmFO [Clostridia bacterium]